MSARASDAGWRGLDRGARGLVTAFAVSGVMHFVRPAPFEAMVPRALPRRRALVHLSGAAELACAAGLLVPQTRRVAGIAAAAVLVGVFPANVEMTRQAARRLQRHPQDNAARGFLAATVVRLPLQWSLVRVALRAAGVTGRRRPGRR
ncbi:DoxX family protein [Terracoccus luteus]|uniref:Putative membrane protein n=1 Tax=Terracoccus luteus TaxID=53356 RepID=A0A495XTN5_9MICO|nr:DoxX family protein [Terracoccus luteus]MBB2985184.1 putative membrane protein [Terracoccus luteus]MCP2170836.1 putative membrane protein [Terracoccus luteus]RKT77557.1 putative membrane protein [Terracoccus luteus]